MKDARRVQFTRFDLPATPELASLRQTIWKGIIALYGDEELQQDVLGLISKYSSDLYRLTNSELVKCDSEYVLPFMTSVLDPGDYRHCVIVNDYLDLLEWRDTEAPDDLRERFRNETYELAELLLPKAHERKEIEMSFEEYDQYKRERLSQYTAGYTFDDYARFFEMCQQIREAQDEKWNQVPFRCGVENVILSLAERDRELYGQVIELYFQLQDPFHLYGYAIVQKLVEYWGLDGALRFLSGPDYPTKRYWLFHLQEILPADSVDEEWLRRLYDLYASAGWEEVPYKFDYLLKYLQRDSRVVVEVVAMILKKAEGEPNFADSLRMLFNPHAEVAGRLTDLFADDLDLLKEAYLAVEGAKNYADYEGELFGQLLDLDPTFIEDFISWKYKSARNGYLSSYDDHRDFAFLWRRSDYQEIMNRVIDIIRKHEKEHHFVSIDPYLTTFFQKRRDTSDLNDDMRKRQDAFLLGLIDERSKDVNFMGYIFGLISQFSPERRVPFVERFVQRNENFGTFKRLPLEPSIWSHGESRVPSLQGRAEFWESLLPIMNTVDLLPHKQYIEGRIQSLRMEIEHEKKKDFIGD